jgi:hypothetical protein
LNRLGYCTLVLKGLPFGTIQPRKVFSLVIVFSQKKAQIDARTRADRRRSSQALGVGIIAISPMRQRLLYHPGELPAIRAFHGV